MNLSTEQKALAENKNTKRNKNDKTENLENEKCKNELIKQHSTILSSKRFTKTKLQSHFSKSLSNASSCNVS